MRMTHQKHILKRLILTRGQIAVVFREKENEFHEPDGISEIGKYSGLFHEANGYLDVLIGESGKTYTAKQPMFLVLFTRDIEKEDLVEIHGTKYRVTGVDDLGNLHEFLDVSLEVL